MKNLKSWKKKQNYLKKYNKDPYYPENASAAFNSSMKTRILPLP